MDRLTATLLRIGFGKHETVVLPAGANREVWEFRPDRGVAIERVRAATARALEAPHDFPAVSQAIVEGDKVVIAVDANIPQVAEIVVGIVDALPLSLISALHVVLSAESQGETADQVRAALSPWPQIEVEIHDPQKREALGYLAANAAAEPIYLNRHLLDADFLIPVLVSRPQGTVDPASLAGGIFPEFTDADTQRRLRAEILAAAGDDDREAAEAAWLLGIQFVVAVLPTAEAEVAAIIAGTPQGIRRITAHAISASWQRDTSRKASLVFACLDGDEQQQTWENVARALYVARHLVQPGGTIVITSQLVEPVGRSLRRLASNETYEATWERLAKDRGRDSLAASLLLQMRQEGRILLLSSLPADEIEALGIGAIEKPDQLPRLLDGHDSCAIIRAAQFCGVGGSDDRS
jgi:hypothetical protein